MKVLLIKDVKSLGKTGEIKEVKEGYGQNFLIGRGFAKKATEEVIAQWTKDQADAKKAEEDEIAALQVIEKKLGDITLTLKKKLGANGSLYGAVTKDEIAHALEDQHTIMIDKKTVELEKNAVKGTGNYDITIKLGHGIHAKLTLAVVGEQ
ncbi:MAG TPA: 50S ribosomal protein L9 [Campylobacterales bacterium]|nr:50S ribosomal protein L9 [Campylobacterales bacterium]